jgi:phosphatidate cytidylyltransferase
VTQSKPKIAADELGRRVISSVVLAAMAIVVTWYGGIAFSIFWGAAATAIFWEWTRMSSYRLSWVASGALYSGVFLLAMIWLRNTSYGLFAIFWLFSIIWSADIVAYFMGRAIGGPKLWPSVSPRKTWSGAIAGTVAGIIAGLTVIWLIGLALSVFHAIIAFIIVIAAQLGDLMESAVKRHFGIKDSSHLIPGHGGVMDRCDSLVAASVMALFIGVARAANAPAEGLLAW